MRIRKQETYGGREVITAVMVYTGHLDWLWTSYALAFVGDFVLLSVLRGTRK